MKTILFIVAFVILVHVICTTTDSITKHDNYVPSYASQVFINNTIGAVCIDGSTPAYYFRQGANTTKFHIAFEGGGWCGHFEKDGYGCFHSCYQRSNTILGSTVNDPSTIDVNMMVAVGLGYMSNNASINPTMWDFNLIFVRYCDGGSFSGNLDEPIVVSGKKLYFRGWRILNGLIDSLTQNYDLNQATEVVISGGSAGALTVYLHLDHIAYRIESAAPNLKKIVGLSDSGFFLDFTPTITPPSAFTNYTGMMQWLYYAMNVTVGAGTPCKLFNSQHPYRCIFAQYISPHILTPIFALQSRFDAWQITCIASVINVKNEANYDYINHFGQVFVDTFEQTFLKHSRNGVFLDSCYHHCGEWDEINIDKLTQADAFDKFYHANQINTWYQSQPFPCHDCCSNYA